MATLIAVAFRRPPPELVIAADSQGTDPEHPNVSLQRCKILRTANFVFTAAGFTADLNGYNVHQLAIAASREGDQPVEQMHVFQDRVRKPLLNALVRMRRIAPEVHNKLCAKDRILTVIFAGIASVSPT